MYIEQGYKGLHAGWQYVIGFLLVFIGWQIIGGFPLLAAILLKSPSLDSLSTDLGVLADLLGLNLFFFVVMLTFLIGMLSLYVVVKYFHKLPWLNFTTSRKKVDRNRIFFAFFLWGGIIVALTLLDIFLAPEDFLFQFELVPFLILFLLSVVFLPIQTSFEEYLTRGYLMQGIGIKAKNRWLPFLISSTLFGLLHIFNPEIEKLGYGFLIFYLGTGFFLGILTLMDEGLELPLGFHAANNFFAALLVTADWTAFKTNSVFKDISEPVLDWTILIPIFVFYPILLFILSRKYGWSDWKEKLFGRVLSKEEFLALEDADAPELQA